MPLEQIAEAAVLGGADVIQLRDKSSSDASVVGTATRIRKAIASKAIFILNDRIEAAKAAGADGVHVGQDDASVEHARHSGPPGWIVGKSTHSVEQAMAAIAEGADYIGFGPIFATPTKPAYEAVGLEDLRQVSKEATVPFFAIGGIDAANMHEVLSQGARRIAVVRAATRDRDIVLSVRKLKENLISHGN